MSTADATLRMILLGEDRSASKTLSGVGATAEKTSGHFASLGKIAAGVFAGGALIEGARKATEFLTGSIEAAVKDEAAQKSLALALQNTTNSNAAQIASVNDWLTAESTALGFSKSDLQPAFQHLAESTGSVTKAQKELKLAMDVSAATGRSLSSVSLALVRANNGATTGLSRFGIATKDASGNTLNLNQELKSMADTFGGQAQARTETLAGSMDRLHATFHEFEIEVGDKAIPILTRFGNWVLAKGIPGAERLGTVVETKLEPAMLLLRQEFAKDSPTVQKWTKTIDQASPSIGRLAGNILTLGHKSDSTGTPALLRFGNMIENKLVYDRLAAAYQGLGALSTGILKVGDAGQTSYHQIIQWGNAFDRAENKAESFARNIPGKIQSAVGNLGHVLYDAGQELIQGLIDGVESKLNALGGVLSHIPGAGHIGIPHLAAGGIVTRPTMALIGEAGPEAVVPLSRAGAFGGGGGDLGTFALDLKLDGKTMQTVLLRLKRERGGLALGLA